MSSWARLAAKTSPSKLRTPVTDFTGLQEKQTAAGEDASAGSRRWKSRPNGVWRGFTPLQARQVAGSTNPRCGVPAPVGPGALFSAVRREAVKGGLALRPRASSRRAARQPQGRRPPTATERAADSE
jgi:hypothetical protein